jgi:hypothetical protein
MLFRVANAVMTLLFLVATFVQYNDPDPIRWMAIYGSSGLPATNPGVASVRIASRPAVIMSCLAGT